MDEETYVEWIEGENLGIGRKRFKEEKYFYFALFDLCIHRDTIEFNSYLATL